jgi:hypothetical protein
MSRGYDEYFFAAEFYDFVVPYRELIYEVSHPAGARRDWTGAQPAYAVLVPL